MDKIELETTKLIGLALKTKTTNALGQSGIDCGNLWQKFEIEDMVGKIPDRLSDDILAVYHQYEGDHTMPFSYFIGCKVKPETVVPEGMDSLIIPKGAFQKITSRGVMPDCVANTWKEIWNSAIPRAYTADIEVYDQRSKDWSNAEVDFYISVR